MRNSEREYFIVKFVFPSKSVFLLWYTDAVDGFVLRPSDNIISDTVKIMTFSEKEEAIQYAHLNAWTLDHSITQIICNLQALVPQNEQFDCNQVLTFWNIVSDFSRLTMSKFSGDEKNGQINDLYNKLFFACNLPSIKKDDREFVPIWSNKEVTLLRDIVTDGLHLLSVLLIDI